MRKGFWLLCMLCCILCTAPAAQAAEAGEISGSALVKTYRGIGAVNRLFDDRFMESVSIRKGGFLTLAHEEGIGSLYLQFDEEDSGYTLTNEDTGEIYSVDEAGFLHVFADLEEIFGEIPGCVTLSFDKEETRLCEIHAFTAGEVPDWVQKWEQPAQGTADLVLFSTHGDDEQLFFAGMLPYYSRELGNTVQVVYMTGHRNMSMRRSHEMLDGLWAVGVRHYPVFGPFGDYNSGSEAEAYQIYRNKNISREDILAFVVENIRRFRPKVAVGHDLQGEYGHGMHMIYASLLCEAVEISMDAEVFPESAQSFGVWDVPKTYLHLYGENRIRMDWDMPLEAFDGMTAYEVTKKLGFPCHVSQQTYYSWYFAGMDTAAQITQYSPCEFGLYRSTVGQDVEKNDFFENVTTHTEDAIQQVRKEEKENQPVLPAETAAAPEETETVEMPAEQEILADAGQVTAKFGQIVWAFTVFAVIPAIMMLKKKK